MKTEIVDIIYQIAVDSGLFAQTYKNYVPVHTTVSEHPAFAVTELDEEIERHTTGSKVFKTDGYVGIYFYALHEDEDYSDLLTPFIEYFKTALNNSVPLQSIVSDCYITKIKRDGTLLYPHSMCEVLVSVSYVDAC